jgi:small GTP-binding protein
MKRVEPINIRNIGTFGHGGEGKTSLVEAILFDTGENTRLGRVDDGSSVMDFEPEEINRKISISASLSHFEYNKYQFHIIDTPGYANFIAEAKASMRVVDGAIIVVSGNSGVKVQTETAWGYANEFQVPRILYVSKMDTERANFLKVVDEKHIVLDRTAFYPEGGGQDSDVGTLSGATGRAEVIDVQKIGNRIIHTIGRGSFHIGEEITGGVDWNRRLSLMRHHTSTHVLMGATRRVLGEHVWQAGAQKEADKSRWMFPIGRG